MIAAQKHNCCGCSACAQHCPQQCIAMKEDEQGFPYPEIDADSCISCGLCEEICPCLNQGEARAPISIEVAINPDSLIRQQSSSGGVFSMLAESVLNDGGVVFGARFNDKWEVEIDYTESMEGLAVFRGSKYLQAKVGESYLKAESFLQDGRKVLFSGTPCQIAGLRQFLQIEYENLLTVAIACHSVPSPLVWKEYLKGLKLQNISDVQFRDKRISWEDYGLKIAYDNGKEFFQQYGSNPYMQLFLHGIITRPSCFNCPAKEGKSGADVIIGDCWGVSQILPDYPNDHQGTSFVVCQTEKGVEAAEKSGVKGCPINYEQIVKYNGGLTTRSSIPEERASFWKEFMYNKDKSRIIDRYTKPFLPSFKNKLKKYLIRLIQ